MKISRDDKYEEMAASFQCAQIQLLDNVLKEHGISLEKRVEINETFTFSLGNFLDQCSFDSEEGRVFPVLGFSDKHWEDESAEELIINEGMFSYHEYAFGSAAWYYEDNAEKENPVDIRVLGEDESS